MNEIRLVPKGRVWTPPLPNEVKSAFDNWYGPIITIGVVPVLILAVLAFWLSLKEVVPWMDGILPFLDKDTNAFCAYIYETFMSINNLFLFQV